MFVAKVYSVVTMDTSNKAAMLVHCTNGVIIEFIKHPFSLYDGVLP
jgi:hypothetical protein